MQQHKSKQDPVLTAQVYRELVQSIPDSGDKVTRDEQHLSAHARLVSYHEQYLPDIVCFPRTTADVSLIHAVCHRHSFPMVPYGRATSLEGHVCAIAGGCVIDMGRMEGIVEFNAQDMDITVEAGVTREQLNVFLRKHGFFFPVDPGANCTLGGMVATRASGTTTIKYQSMRENVLRLQVVLPDGTVITTARRAKKSAAGYDLTRLFVGSEGTLGTIVQVTLKIYAIPSVVGGAICPFTSIKDAANSVIQIIQRGVPIARVELLDEMAIKAVNENNGLEYRELPTLFFEFQGTSANDISAQAQIVKDVCIKGNAGIEFNMQIDEREREKLWRARHKAYYSTLALRPDCKALTTDTCVPISNLASVIVETKKEFNETGLLYTLVGHVGDGNFHLIVCLDPNKPEEREAVERVYDKLIFRALKAQGTCTGEHGIGLGKMHFMLHELGSDAVQVMRTIKEALDPRNVMNPFKLIPSRKDIQEFRAKYEQASSAPIAHTSKL